MAFTIKDWKDLPASLEPNPGETVEDWRQRIIAYNTANPGALTPLNAAALEDLEARLSGYTDTVQAGGPIAHATRHEAGGSDPSAWALATRSVLEVGVLNQTRAGRELVPADFTDLGLAAPVGLWNLSNVNDSSGNGRNLTNKGTVLFGKDILGAAAGAAVFAGSTAQALWRADEAATSIKVGTWGCWFRTAKRGTHQYLMTKTATGQLAYELRLRNDNLVDMSVYHNAAGTQWTQAAGFSDLADDRWHFVVATFDGTALRLFADGVLEVASSSGVTPGGPIADTTAPLNIGGGSADAGTATVNPHYGRIDEAFLTNEVLSEDQIRCLMAVKLPHGAARAPRRAGLCVRRRRRGSLLTQADFTALGLVAPTRIYNLDDQSDDGVGAVTLTSNGGVAAGGVAGPAGKAANAAHFDGADDYFSATDTGLPATTTVRTLLAWFKTTNLAQGVILGYGTAGTNNDEFVYVTAAGLLEAPAVAGALFVADGAWHLMALVCDNGAADGVKTKLYCDGRLVSASTTIRSITLVGANGLRIGARQSGVNFFKGQVARVAVEAAVMTPDQLAAIYARGSQDLGLSPYPPGEYVERLNGTGLYVLSERGTLEDQEQVELEVAA